MAGGGVRTPPPPPELQAARDAVVQVVKRLSDMIAHPLRELTTNPSAKTRPLLTGNFKTLAELDRLIREADRALTPVRGELDEVCRTLPNSHDSALALSREFRDEVTRFRDANPPTVNEMQRWLARIGLMLDGILAGIDANPRAAYSPKSGIDYELKQAAMRRQRMHPRQSRVRCEPSDRSVWLDGKLIEAGLDPDVFAYFSLLADRYPDHIAFPAMQKKSAELDGVHQGRLKNKLPAKLKGLVTVTKGKGHALKLPA